MSKTFHKYLFLFSILYLAVISAFLVWHRAWFSPDQFFAAAMLGTLFLGRFMQFVRDWSFPTILYLSYEYLRGLAPILSGKAHVWPMINFDRLLFGVLPTNSLQRLFFDEKNIRWWDTGATVLYVSHFIVPMIAGFVFWLLDKKIFKEYFLALLILSYLGFITFVIFPAVPPWLASERGYIPHVESIMGKVFESFGQPMVIPTIYSFFGANQVAAVPSLHAAYPLLTALFIMRKFKRRGILTITYVLGVWFSVVYLGEHYVFDVVAGAAYAIFVFWIVVEREKVLKRISALLRILKRNKVLTAQN